MRHVYECPIRRADLHPGGIVDNVAYLDFLQEARLDLLRRFDAGLVPSPGEGLVVVRTDIEYLEPLSLATQPLTVETWVTEVRAASFTLGYALVTHPEGGDGPRVHARATTVLTPFVFSEGRPRRLTPVERERLDEGIEESPIPAARQRWDATFGEGDHHTSLLVRFSDIDLLGHVNNVRYLDFVHESVVDVLVGGLREAAVDGHVQTVVARTEIDYVGQLNLRPEPYDVWTRVARVGETSVTFESEIRDGDRPMARARVVQVFLDEERRSAALRSEHRAVFERLASAQHADGVGTVTDQPEPA